MEDMSVIYKNKLCGMVRRFKDERQLWQDKYEQARKENLNLKKEAEKQRLESEKDTRRFSVEIKELDENLKQAELQRKNFEEELDKRMLQEQTGKISRMEEEMFEGIRRMAKKMAKKELQWTSKFSAAQKEIRVLVCEKSEADIKYRARQLDNALKSAQEGFGRKIEEIEFELDKNADDFWPSPDSI